MVRGKFVAYYRVSIEQQGRSGLGLEAQRKAVLDYLNGGSWELVEEFTEIEGGGRNDRPQLAAALAACRLYGATFVIAKLDRLSRDAHFLLGLQKADVDFLAVDMPSANKLTVGILTLVAEEERRAISARTKAALAAAKARGTVLGGYRGGPAPSAADRAAAAAAVASGADDFAAHVRPTIERFTVQNPAASLRQIAAHLAAKGVPTRRGCSEWTAAAVARVLAR